MNLNDYFDPVSLDKPDGNLLSEKSVFCKSIAIHTPDNPIPSLASFDIALMGLPGNPSDWVATPEAGVPAPGLPAPCDRIRNHLYQLFRVSQKLKIIDLGNLKPGKTRRDTTFALRDACLELFERNILVINFGGSQELTYGCYLAFEAAGRSTGFVSVDARLDMGIIEEEITAGSYLVPILSGKRDILISYTNLGHQKYFVDQQDLDYLDRYHYQSIRLGDIRADLTLTEPYLRDAGLVGFDLGSIKQSDAPASSLPSPNGFYSEEICRISRYAGLGNKISCYGIYNLASEANGRQQTSQLAAQMIWYFLDGYSQRIIEHPSPGSRDYKKFIVNMNSPDVDVVFYKSLQTDRWWCSVPYRKSSGEKDKFLLLSCSREDYDRACNQEIPDRWWKAYKKLN